MALTPTQQHFTKFYLAAFLRAPDLGGLNYWANEVQSGKSLQEVGGVIFSLPIVTNIYPANLSDLDFVEAIYHNVFGRNSDAEGLNYWSNEIATLRSGFIAQGHDAAFAAFEARGQLTINMINAGLGTPDGTDGKAYIVNRLTVAEYAAEQQLAQGEEIAVAFLLETFRDINADALSVLRGNSEVNSFLSHAINLADIAEGTGGFVIKGQANVDIQGEVYGDYSGWSVSGAGDVNGDGAADLIVGSYLADPTGRGNAGKSYVVFGKADGAAVDLSYLSNGFVIDGQAAGDQSGHSVSDAGDVNGDGLADLIVGAAGKSYVVFGKADGLKVDLANVASGNGGFVINGETAGDGSGWSVSSAGDVDGDGLADLIVGAPAADPAAGTNAGKSYVVFGKRDSTEVNLSAIADGTGGFVINGQTAVDNSGYSVSSAGDVNGDGLGDLIVGAYAADPVSGQNAGKSYVVFGKANQSTVDLANVASGNGGFVINGQATPDYSGFSVSSAGDVNGDGLADLIIGAPGPSNRNYVVFGKTDGTPVELANVNNGSGGFVIRGSMSFDNHGFSVSSAGDMNGDGLSDVIIGAPGVADNAAGESYVVFGKTDGTAIELASVADGEGGFAIHGQTSDHSGTSVSAAGDVNGDGLADLIVGAPRASSSGGGADIGKSYVIFGRTTGVIDQTAVNQIGTPSDDTLNDGGTAQTLIGYGGNDTLVATAASTLFGCSGDDTLVIESAMITALSSGFGEGGNILQLARIDGGTGLDTIMLSELGQSLDLTQGVASSRIENVEIIDLTGMGNNTLTLSSLDVKDMLQFSHHAFAELGGATGIFQLMVKGNAGDVLDLANAPGTVGWTQDGNVTLVGVSYSVWYAEYGLATLYVDTALSVI